jgi:hypothetical protein
MSVFAATLDQCCDAVSAKLPESADTYGHCKGEMVASFGVRKGTTT